MRCNHTKNDGERCKASALPGKQKCMFHHPSFSRKRAEGRRAGGTNRSVPVATLAADTPDLALATVADVVVALAATINQVRNGKLAVGVGNCVGCLAGVLLKALEGSQLEQRIAALESCQTHQRRIAR